MAGFADMRTMDVWYAHLSEADLMAAIKTFAQNRGGSTGTPRVARRI